MAEQPIHILIVEDDEVDRMIIKRALKSSGINVDVIFAEDHESGTSLNLGIERASDGALIGNCALFDFHEASRRAQIGYCLGRPYWGAGYMQEALGALLDHAFSFLGLHRLEADIDPRNSASATLLERLGFTREGFLRERWIVGGEVSDTALYGLLQHEWRKRT